MELQHPLAVVTGGVDGDLLQVFASVPEEFTATQLHGMIPRRSLAGIRYALDRLVSQGIVLRRGVGRTQLYRLNERHLAAEAIRALASQKSVLLARMREALSAWHVPPVYAALFGSAARGEMTDESDLDIFLVRDDGADEHWFVDSAAFAADVTGWTGNDTRIVDLHVGDLDDDVTQPLLRNVASDGLRLAGDGEWLRGRLRKGELR